MPLVKPLTKLGASKAVILPKSWLEYHEAEMGHVIDSVYMDVDGCLRITPAPEKKLATKKRGEHIVQFEVLEYVWHSAKTFDTREAFRKNIRHLLDNIANNGAINFEKLRQDLKKESDG